MKMENVSQIDSKACYEYDGGNEKQSQFPRVSSGNILTKARKIVSWWHVPPHVLTTLQWVVGEVGEHVTTSFSDVFHRSSFHFLKSHMRVSM